MNIRFLLPQDVVFFGGPASLHLSAATQDRGPYPNLAGFFPLSWPGVSRP